MSWCGARPRAESAATADVPAWKTVLDLDALAAAWLDDDTLLLSRDWDPGTTTVSGYPFVIKALRRPFSLRPA